ncbi:ABC transporter substrate-binding protein [Chromobacterium sp. IIBBL 290-4]|uniref:substrate-binding periplasmic protein n=1 Tax=Chromobacterium sp. IIBBL 290-4 TaxID=2953890 RepID=UPI0020B6BF83|nr:transporter substrate-binding domain-containing protein [Chromobacterium sp. IIBBL 290-4]UTH74910.1 transporter substrate-binding domain-containing protein [Chromobacterium sp. IIBBL 290-4]
MPSARALSLALIAAIAYAAPRSAGAAADDVMLSTGDFPPYTSEKLPQGGITSMIVREAFRAAGLPEPRIVFLPWKRGYSETEAGHFAAGFPYARDAKREQSFLYSEPLHLDKFSYFVRKDNAEAAAGQWQGMRLCLPLGWTSAYTDADSQAYRWKLERPATLDNCWKMLENGAVDLVSCNDFVAAYAIRQLFGAQAPFAAAAIGKDQSSALYLIISRKLPDGEALMRQFNAGLAEIKRNGRYRQLLQKAQDASAAP